MYLRDYLRMIMNRWKLVGVWVLASLCGSVVLTLLTTPTYQATTQLFVSVSATSEGGTASELMQGGSFSAQQVKSYAAIASSPRVTEPVIERLGLDMGTGDLASRIEAEAPLETVLINLTVTDTSAVRSARIANALAGQFVEVVEELERPANTATSPVKLTVTQRAEPPASPISPRPVTNALLGLLAGLALGIGSAVIREALDVSVKTSDDLGEAAGAAVLGAVIFDTGITGSRALLTGSETQTIRGEAYRRLRTNMQFVDVDEHPRTIVVTSALPGEGKSTTASNLALTLAHAGGTVCLVDGDLRRPSVATSLGLIAEVGLTTVLIGKASLENILQGGPDGLSVVTSGPIPPNPSELLGSHHMGEVLKSLSERFDMVIIDSPPLLPVTDAAVLAAQADGAIVVVRANKTSRQQVSQAVEALKAVDARLLGTVLNMAPAKRGHAASYGYAYSYTSEANKPRGDGPRHSVGADAQRSEGHGP